MTEAKQVVVQRGYMENRDRQRDFKDFLREFIDANGGMARENLLRIVRRAREVKDDFSLQRLLNLLQGYPPTDDDRLAISETLELESERWMSRFWPLEDQRARDLARFGIREFKTPIMAKKFVDYVQNTGRYRNAELPDREKRTLANEFRSHCELEDEEELFALPIQL